MPTALMDDVPPDVIDTQRAENERAANAATSRLTLPLASLPFSRIAALSS